ncbi:MAG: 5-formyltetrahydrofolate cyclo-ligase [Brumimicrobium sp.]|nr:5-formyltetrahydrofolate cyclo-ligase [Brumimicrobium sp.]MCO5268391.1 5-formyltetrahydrofolate cyclo-ligase [Brumimicrobium sp.]
MTRDEIRESYRNKRSELSTEQCLYFSQVITNNFLKNWDFEGKTIDCFLTIHRMKEVDTSALINRLQKKNQICVPVSNFNNNSMRHVLLNDHTVFQETTTGIPEPVVGEDVNIKDIDVVIVPLLAVDQNGNRLGYGKGFYDRFLAECKPSAIFIGLTMFDIHDDFTDIDPYDIPLHYVVTPKGILKTGVEYEGETDK